MTSRDTMMNDKRTLRDDLIAAKALIDTPEKWGKGNYLNAAGCLCALGAVRKAIYGSPYGGAKGDWVGDLNPAANMLADMLPEGEWSVSDFNDKPATLHPDIMAMFDRAIAAAEVQS